MSLWAIYGIGFLAQFLFSLRLVIQWLSSEKEKRVVTPILFWIVSLMASILLFIYGILRHDFAIMLGQAVTHYIYIRNLQLQNEWGKFPQILRWLVISFPILSLIYLLYYSAIEFNILFQNEDIPLWLLLLGSAAQLVFALRFVYQWLFSEVKKRSILPFGFWLISLVGSLMILIYAMFRADWVLIVGHSFGSFVYIRNMMLSKQ
ncbi:MAG: lipid-A-disaccharide synthase N-terminal domain-containing protein [Psychroserpens sp.]|uniref:lipid-A-disaccharide synthase N-terminal domain-containing protein n=1 Tax=Psychroserpens sp. TaxID=2020870 RepID=UPI003C74F932